MITKTIGEHSAMELEAAAALLMLRYQYELVGIQGLCSGSSLPRPPTPPPPQTMLQQLASVAADKCTPKDQVVRGTVSASAQPLKKRSVPPHLLRRSLTPAKSQNSHNISSGSGGIQKTKMKTATPNRQRNCTKALLKSCRNMIREFLDNQELV
ncbi:uncharacterized protein LOC115631265 [Scaptodrosophila lebanonensis]|uniref:Uncharacterized protein LOC115631265 n=1 Tax=Drosophila lebanonensis TaxID=7225 RepID=A0A6J2U9I8_DROLE|nr:uncharacterized protein LOC115631265 [Scaptodrosophila lebanonensis]